MPCGQLPANPQQLWDVETLQEMKQYTTETPLNSACIAPLRPYIILGGGQDAMNVTTTGQRAGKFESRFWHKLFEEEVGRVRGHLYVSSSASSVRRTLLGRQEIHLALMATSNGISDMRRWATSGWTGRRKRSSSAILMYRRRRTWQMLTNAAVPSTLSPSNPKARHKIPAPKTALSVSTGYVIRIFLLMTLHVRKLSMRGHWRRTTS